MALEDMGTVIGGPFMRMWNEAILSLPGVIVAILIILLGYLIGALIGQIVKKILEKTRVLGIIIKKMNIEAEIGKWNLNNFFGLIIKWYIFVVFLNPAAEAVGLTGFSNFLGQIALWIPNIIFAIIISLAGYVFAEYISKKIKETKAKNNSLLAALAKIITTVIVILIALKQIGIRVDVAENSFLIILGGVMLCFAIAFGLALKDEAKNIVKEIRKRI